MTPKPATQTQTQAFCAVCKRAVVMPHVCKVIKWRMR